MTLPQFARRGGAANTGGDPGHSSDAPSGGNSSNAPSGGAAALTPLLGGLVNQIADHVADVQAPILQPLRRAIIRGQGAKSTSVLVSGAGQGAATIDLPVYTAYTSTMVNMPGGPQVGDDVLLSSNGEGNRMVLMKVNY